jgi:hypothetical protein
MAVAKSLQYAPDTFEHGVVKPFAIEQAPRVQRFSNGKHHMEIFYIQSIANPVVDPNRLFV